MMRRSIQDLFSDTSVEVKRKTIGMYAMLLAFNLGAWTVAFIAFHANPLLMGTAFLAYSFGLRHAVDADHIAAIDNVTRKLMQEGKRPVTVGFMFSLGHSTVVILACVAIAATELAFKQQMDSAKEIGEIIGTLVSTFFLFTIALMNLIVLHSVFRAFLGVRRGEPYVEDEFNSLLANRGFFSRIFRPIFNIISRSWHMFPLGVLFGMSFDTATEIGLLGISAAEASKGLPIWSIMIFPALFTAGMSLIDTTDNVLMLGAYGWAFLKPVRKLYYNMTITFVSVVAEIIVGGIEGLGLLAEKLHLIGRFWSRVSSWNENFGMIGYLIIGLFVSSWVLSLAIFKWCRFDDIERDSSRGG